MTDADRAAFVEWFVEQADDYLGEGHTAAAFVARLAADCVERAVVEDRRLVMEAARAALMAGRTTFLAPATFPWRAARGEGLG